MSVGRLADHLLGMIGLARLKRHARADAGQIAKVQTEGHADDEFQHWQPYGLQARAKAGADVLTIDIGADASGRIALVVADRRYTIALADGEVALVDDLGQRVHLTRNGIVLEAPTIKLGAGATLAVARVGDSVVIAGTDGVPTTWLGWLGGLATAASYAAPLPTSALGLIDEGSPKVKAE